MLPLFLHCPVFTVCVNNTVFAHRCILIAWLNISSKRKPGPKATVLTILLALPEGVVPLFLSSKTQELFGVHADIDVTADNPLKIISKEQVLQDLYNRAAISDFHPVKPLMVVCSVPHHFSIVLQFYLSVLCLFAFILFTCFPFPTKY